MGKGKREAKRAFGRIILKWIIEKRRGVAEGKVQWQAVGNMIINQGGGGHSATQRSVYCVQFVLFVLQVKQMFFVASVVKSELV